MKQWTPRQIRRARLARRQTQAAFAFTLHVHPVTVAKWECELQAPSLRNKPALDDLGETAQ